MTLLYHDQGLDTMSDHRVVAESPLLQFFNANHLPMPLKDVSLLFCNLAQELETRLPRNAEKTTALRKLLEAKDCAVRALIAR